MTSYNPERSSRFKSDIKKLKNRHETQKRLIKKVVEICSNTHINYKHLRSNLKGQQRVHIDSFVLTFTVDHVREIITYHAFDHHDNVY